MRGKAREREGEKGKRGGASPPPIFWPRTAPDHRRHDCPSMPTRADLSLCLSLSISAMRCRSSAFTRPSRTSSSSWSFTRCRRFARDSWHARLFLRRRSTYRACRDLASSDFRAVEWWYVWSSSSSATSAQDTRTGSVAASAADGAGCGGRRHSAAAAASTTLLASCTWPSTDEGN